MIGNLGTPQYDNDACSYGIVVSKYSALNIRLSQLNINTVLNTGVTSDCSFGGFNLTNVKDPINAQDGATKNYVDNKVSSYVFVNNSDFDLKTHKLINVVDPVNNQDGATKHYVDNSFTSTNIVNNISNNSINPLKLILPVSNQTTTFLRGDGSFSSLPP